MKRLLLVMFCMLVGAGLATTAFAIDPVFTDLPAGGESHPPEDWQGGVPCDQLIRYDDGTDDTPNSGYTLGGPSEPQQFLGVIFTPPAGAEWEVQSAAFFSEFWVTPGNVNFQAREEGNPANLTTEPLFVSDGGNWEIAFSEPICVAGDYSIMLCPDNGTWGVSGEDTSAPDNRSYFNQDVNGCSPDNSLGPVDLMIWSCVTPCGAVATEAATWGSIKSMYK